MTGRIYLLSEKSGLVAMEEAAYDSEKLLQEMLANHADLLAGEQINSDEPSWTAPLRGPGVGVTPCGETAYPP